MSGIIDRIRCPHDYVVKDMLASGRGAGGMKAYYIVECENCGNVRKGLASDIPRASFK